MTWPFDSQPPRTDTCAQCGLPLDDSPSAYWCSSPIPHPAGGVTYARSPEEYQRYLEDAAPAEAPPEPGHEKARPLSREPGGVSDQRTSPFGFTEFGQHTPPPSIIRRILNATRRNT